MLVLNQQTTNALPAKCQRMIGTVYFCFWSFVNLMLLLAFTNYGSELLNVLSVICCPHNFSFLEKQNAIISLLSVFGK
jgi:hypothetical protein